MYDPYAARGPHSGPYPPNHGYPGPGVPGQRPPRAANTTSPLVLGILMTLCCNQVCGILAIVFAAVAMGKDNEPSEQVRFVRYANISLVVGIIIPIVAVVLYVLFVVLAIGAGI